MYDLAACGERPDSHRLRRLTGTVDADYLAVISLIVADCTDCTGMAPPPNRARRAEAMS